MRHLVVPMLLGSAVSGTGCATQSVQTYMPHLQARAETECHGLPQDARDSQALMKDITRVEPLVEDYRPNQKVRFRRTTGIELHHPGHRGITSQYLQRVARCLIAQNTIKAARGLPHDGVFTPRVRVNVLERAHEFHLYLRGESPAHAEQLMKLAQAQVMPGGLTQPTHPAAAQ